MMPHKIFLCSAAFAACLLIGLSSGQDWLEGGSVGRYSGDNAQYFTDPIFYPNPVVGQTYQPKSGFYGFYPGPYGVFPYYGMLPYYSDFRLKSLGAMTWEPFQKNWSETMEYAQTKSSFKAYPTPTATYPGVQFPAPIYTPTPIYTTTSPPAAATGDSTATIVSQGMRGYQVFLDGKYIGTEGTGGDLPDGKFSFRVAGGQNHDIRVYDGQFNYPKTIFFERGGTKIINVEPGTAAYI